jgi:hypothetical protein
LVSEVFVDYRDFKGKRRKHFTMRGIAGERNGVLKESHFRGEYLKDGLHELRIYIQYHFMQIYLIHRASNNNVYAG